MSLSAGHIKQINGGKTGLEPSLLQVLDLTKNQAGRYVPLVSDSEFKMKGLLPSSLDKQIEAGEIMNGSVIQVDKYVVNTVNGSKVMVILKLTILQADCVVIGEPKPVPVTAAPQKKAASGFGGGGGFASSNNPFQKKSSSAGGDDEFQPVNALSPFQRDFKIKVRVTRKGDMRTWSNDRGQGKLFSVDLLDGHGGEIQATMFNDAADKFYAIFEEGKVYTIKKGRVKVANKRYTHIKNDYQLDLSMDSVVEFVGDDTAISGMKYDFKPLSELSDMQDKSFVDVCGICDNVSDLQEFTSKAGKELTKRSFRIVDQSNHAVDCTLWGDLAKGVDPEMVNQSVCIKAARVSDFNGKSLSVNKYSINPEGVAKAKEVMQWWTSGGNTQNFNSMSTGGGGGAKSSPAITIREFEKAGMGTGEKPDYFNTVVQVKGVPVNFEKPPWYKAVPEEGIPAYKVVQADDGASWYCEKNQKTYESYKCRYILRMTAFDHTKDHWFNCYNDVAEKIIGVPANELEVFVNNGDENGLKNVFRGLIGKSFNARVRAKQEIYNDEARQRCDILQADDIDYSAESARMLDRIKEMISV